MITGRRLRRLEHAADPDAAGEVDVGADLRARADRRPRVDHRPRPDPGADVHVARHQHDALGEERAVARDPRRHDAHARARRSPSSAGSCRGTERARLDRLHLPQPEVHEDRLLRLDVDDPARRRPAPPRARSPRSSAATISSASSGVTAPPRRIADRARALLLGRDERDAEVALAGCAEIRPRRDQDTVLEQPLRERPSVSPAGTSSQRYIVASLPATRMPLRVEELEEERALAAVALAGLRPRAPRRPRRRSTRAGRTPAAPCRPWAGTP